jgi:putative hydrolase of the HAD superfamily
VTANAQPILAAVLFDYGHTLVDIRWRESTLVDGERIFLEALPAPGVPLEEFHEETVTLLREAEAAVVDHVEVDYPALVRRALARFGVTPAAADLAAAMRAQILSWNSVRHVHPDAYELLDALRARGLRIGYVSNTYDPPEILREVIRDEGMEERADAIVLSSELGFRKPSPRIYQAALREVDAPAAATLFVGDRVLEDVVGPAREGMYTCLATWFRSDDGDHALAGSVAEEPLQVLQVVDGGRGA